MLSVAMLWKKSTGDQSTWKLEYNQLSNNYFKLSIVYLTV